MICHLGGTLCCGGHRLLSPNESGENSSALCESKAELTLQEKGEPEQPDLMVGLVLQ